jgi:hypothetical protein
MKRLLIAVLLLVTGIKFIPGYASFYYDNYYFSKLAPEAEESEQEKGKTKNDIEDKIFRHSFTNLFLHTSPLLLNIPQHQDGYLDFLESPATPPPDTV